jgi:hypothetical protein
VGGGVSFKPVNLAAEVSWGFVFPLYVHFLKPRASKTGRITKEDVLGFLYPFHRLKPESLVQ